MLACCGRSRELFAMALAVGIPPIGHEYSRTFLIHYSPFGGGGSPPLVTGNNLTCSARLATLRGQTWKMLVQWPLILAELLRAIKGFAKGMEPSPADLFGESLGDTFAVGVADPLGEGPVYRHKCLAGGCNYVQSSVVIHMHNQCSRGIEEVDTP